MNKRSVSAGILYCLTPLFFYLLVSTCAGAVMEAAWAFLLQERVLQSADAAYTYAIRTVWSCLSLVIPAGAGALSVRQMTAQELRIFQKTEPVPGSQRRMARILPVLLVSVMFLSLGINVCFSMIFSGAETEALFTPGALPGPAGIVLQALIFGLYMPLIEELVFRGCLFSRLERVFGLRAALPVSAALFGIYHGTAAQGVYAFLMGLVFAAAYARTRRFAVPYALHGVCNLAVLLLGWLNLYSYVCTPAWTMVFLEAAAAGLITIRWILKNK